MGIKRQGASLGRQVLLVEEQMVPMLLAEDALLAAGYRVATAASFHGTTRAMTTCMAEVAVLDLDLADQSSILLADELTELGVPIIFASARSDFALPQRFAHVRVLGKPYRASELVAGVNSLLGLETVTPAGAAEATPQMA